MICGGVCGFSTHLEHGNWSRCLAGSSRIGSPMNSRPKVLVLTPVYNESAGLDAYEARVRQVLLARPECDISVLFIEDGSTDDSWARICALAARDNRFHGI